MARDQSSGRNVLALVISAFEGLCVLIGLVLVLWGPWLWSLPVGAVALWRMCSHWNAADLEEQVTNLTVDARRD